ncbi:MAG: hypothetical protein ACOCV2_15615 [Persicimonas sp.]
MNPKWLESWGGAEGKSQEIDFDEFSDEEIASLDAVLAAAEERVIDLDELPELDDPDELQKLAERVVIAWDDEAAARASIKKQQWDFYDCDEIPEAEQDWTRLCTATFSPHVRVPHSASDYLSFYLTPVN